MTDNEIIKALHCKCGGEMVCISCPYYARYPDCDRYAVRDALSLINRQQAEIERLQGYNENLQTANTYLSNEILEAKAEAIKEVAERLKEEQEFFVNECDDFVGYVAVSRIDNLTKEMVGDSDA